MKPPFAILWQDDQLVGVIGGSGGMNIISAVTQVFLNHFILGMQPLDAVLRPRVYTKVLTLPYIQNSFFMSNTPNYSLRTQI